MSCPKCGPEPPSRGRRWIKPAVLVAILAIGAGVAVGADRSAATRVGDASRGSNGPAAPPTK